MIRLIRIFASGATVLVLTSAPALAQGIPKVSVQVGNSTDPGDLSTTLQIIILLTAPEAF